MKRPLLLACTALTATVLAYGAHAQIAPAGAPVATAPADNSAPPVAAGGVQEVVVTAEKRAQSLQTVPVAVSAFTAQTRDTVGILSTKDLTNYTPGLSYSSSLDRITLRGISRFTNDLTADPGIANYIDGFYTSFAVASAEDPLFVDRVEVLRGPQGTLYGRNSIGGAINVISKMPLDHFQGEVRATFGNYDRQQYVGYITGPLPFLNNVGGLSGWDYRLSYGHTEQDKGWFHSLSPLPTQTEVRDENYYEAQFKGRIGERIDVWGKWSRQAYDNKAGPSLVHVGGAFNPTPDPQIFPAGSLAPNPALGYVPGATVNPVFYGPAIYNPATALGDLYAFNNNTDFNNRVSHQNTFTLSTTFHGDGFDVKYEGGWLKYHYDQLYDYDNTNAVSYILPLATTPQAQYFGFGSQCALANAFGTACGPATIYPTQKGYYAERKEFYSHELNISSTGKGPLQWIAGLYYYNENYTQEFYIAEPDQVQLATPVNGGAPNPNRYLYYTNTPFQGDSKAAYGQVDWKFAPTWKLTAGLRYSEDTKDGQEQQRLVCFGLPACGASITNLGTLTPAVDISAAVDPSPAGTRGVVAGSFIKYNTNGQPYSSRLLSDKYSATTGTLGLEWQPDRHTLAFAKYTRGYKAGGFNSGSTGTFAAKPDTNPEHVDAYELGLKETWNRTLQTNISLFYYNYTDAQVPLTAIPATGAAAVAQSLFVNLPKVEDFGVEVETVWSPIPRLNVLFNYSYLDAKITNACCFVDGTDPTATAPGAKPVAGTTVGAGTVSQQTAQDLSGNRMPSAPRNKVSINGNYTFDLGNHGTLIGSLSYIWKDKSYSSIFNRWYNQIPTQQQWDTRFTWTSPNNKYSVVFYGQNIFNETIYESKGGIRQAKVANPINAVTDYAIYQSYALAPPRTYGVQLQLRF